MANSATLAQAGLSACCCFLSSSSSPNLFSSLSLFRRCPLVSRCWPGGDISPCLARRGPNAAAIDEPCSCQHLHVPPATAPAPQLGAHCLCRPADSCLPNGAKEAKGLLVRALAIWGGAGRGPGLDKGRSVQGGRVPASTAWVDQRSTRIRWSQGEVVVMLLTVVSSKSRGPPILVDRGRTDNGQTGLPATKSQSADGACLALCEERCCRLSGVALFDSCPPLSRAALRLSLGL